MKPDCSILLWLDHYYDDDFSLTSSTIVSIGVPDDDDDYLHFARAKKWSL